MDRVLLIGDSIRMHYQPYVRTHLASKADVHGPKENCESSRKVLTRLSEWIEDYPPDLVHLNCGLHDIRADKPGLGVQVPLAEYAQNVEAILRYAQTRVAHVIWATTTPINEALIQMNKTSQRSEADLSAYNQVAVDRAQSLSVEIDDLWGLVMAYGADALWERDGVHLNEEGYRLIGKSVADKIRQCFASGEKRA